MKLLCRHWCCLAVSFVRCEAVVLPPTTELGAIGTLSLSISLNSLILQKGKGKGKVHPRTGHEGPEGEYRYSSTLSLTSALDGVNATPRPLYPRERPGTHFTGGWVGPRVGSDG